jgi:hypothetical protein
MEKVPSPRVLTVSLLGLKEDMVIEGRSTGISGVSARDSLLLTLSVTEAVRYPGLGLGHTKTAA